MDALTLFGLAAVTAMLVFYALEDRNRWYSLAFAGITFPVAGSTLRLVRRRARRKSE